MEKNNEKETYIIYGRHRFFCVILMSNNAPVQAKAAITSKGKKAIQAYQKLLSQNTIKWYQYNGYTTRYASDRFYFILADVNSDGVPELFLRNRGGASHSEGYEAVYVFYKNKARRLTANDEITSFYPKGGIVEMNYFGMGGATQYEKILKQGKRRLVAEISCPRRSVPYDPPTEYYWHKGKKITKVSKSAFKSYLKKSTGKKRVKIKNSDWHKNTAGNRNDMEKLLKKK